MEYDRDRVLVVGAGIIGVCTAYYLLKAGRPVTMIDCATSPHTPCSYGNAGMIVPSHFTPLAAPGMITKGISMMADSESPFSIKPRTSLDLLRWCKIFMAHCSEEHTAASAELLRDLNLESRNAFLSLSKDAGVDISKRGLLSLCTSQKALDAEAMTAARANHIGVQAEVCSPQRLAELDPDIEMTVLGGVWYQQDCHLDPGAFMQGLRKKIIEMGAEIIPDARVKTLKKGSSQTVSLEGVDTPPDLQIVLATGIWSAELMKSLGIRMPMQAGKGYSLTLPNPRQQPRLCSILAEAKVAVTPFHEQLRFAGTMEICGEDLSVNHKRVRGIVKSIQSYFPAYNPSAFDGIEPWAGLRPCSPDGLPYIGRVNGFSNLTVATGHAMMGLSLGPITGQLVTDILTTEQPRLDIRRLDPLRFR